MDSVTDSLVTGRRFRALTIVDDYSRECPVIEVDTSIGGKRVVSVLNRLGEIRGLPEAITIDNGPEFAGKALDESIDAISSHFNIEKEPLGNYADDLLRRYSNKYLNDTVARVGRDPKRKLGPDDRLTGAASFCIKNGIMPEYIPVGIAAAFLFDVPDDVSSPEVINTVRTKGIETALTEYTSVPRESELYSKIINIYKSLK